MTVTPCWLHVNNRSDLVTPGAGKKIKGRKHGAGLFAAAYCCSSSRTNSPTRPLPQIQFTQSVITDGPLTLKRPMQANNTKVPRSIPVDTNAAGNARKPDPITRFLIRGTCASMRVKGRGRLDENEHAQEVQNINMSFGLRGMTCAKDDTDTCRKNHDL